MIASMRNGSGDHFFVLFNASGAIIKGFAHESPMSPYQVQPPCIWPGVLDDVPAEFADFLAEPAFSLEETSFCCWRLYSQSSWHRGDIEFANSENPDGSRDLLLMFEGNPRTYRDWATDYHEQPVDFKAVSLIYKYRPLSDDIMHTLNGDSSLSGLIKNAEEIGYPDL